MKEQTFETSWDEANLKRSAWTAGVGIAAVVASATKSKSDELVFLEKAQTDAEGKETVVDEFAAKTWTWNVSYPVVDRNATETFEWDVNDMPMRHSRGKTYIDFPLQPSDLKNELEGRTFHEREWRLEREDLESDGTGTGTFTTTVFCEGKPLLRFTNSRDWSETPVGLFRVGKHTSRAKEISIDLASKGAICYRDGMSFCKLPIEYQPPFKIHSRTKNEVKISQSGRPPIAFRLPDIGTKWAFDAATSLIYAYEKVDGAKPTEDSLCKGAVSFPTTQKQEASDFSQKCVIPDKTDARPVKSMYDLDDIPKKWNVNGYYHIMKDGVSHICIDMPSYFTDPIHLSSASLEPSVRPSIYFEVYGDLIGVRIPRCGDNNDWNLYTRALGTTQYTLMAAANFPLKPGSGSGSGSPSGSPKPGRRAKVLSFWTRKQK